MKIIAFYDMLLYGIICFPLALGAFLVLMFGQLSDFNWVTEHWGLVLLFALGIILPIVGTLFVRSFIIENHHSARIGLLPFTTNWTKAANNIDVRWNQDVFLSEIKEVEVITLGKEERENKTFYKHWFNRYLKITLNYGNPKYFYVGNYSDYQIRKIINLLAQVTVPRSTDKN